MFDRLKSGLVDNMVKSGVIQEEDAELYCYGFDTLKAYLCATAVTLGIGGIMHSFWESIIFLIAFKTLRTTAGGYHASSYLRCFFSSGIVLILALGVIKYAKYIPVWLIISLIVLNILTVFLFAPLPDDNKPINEKEQKYHKKKSRILNIVESVISLVLLPFQKTFSVTILMACVTVTFLLVAWVVLRKLKLNMKIDSKSESQGAS